MQKIHKKEEERDRNFKAGLAKIRFDQDKRYWANCSKALAAVAPLVFNKEMLSSSKISTTEPSTIFRNTKSSLKNHALPHERIFINHLSRNRGLDNFNEVPFNMALLDTNYINDQLDGITTERIRIVLEKFRKTMVIVKNGIETLFNRTISINLNAELAKLAQKRRFSKLSMPHS